MKNYIFITTEGYTYSPNNSDSEPDVENCQVLGFESGKNAEEAFNNLKISNSFLNDLGYNEVICDKLSKYDKAEQFNIK